MTLWLATAPLLLASQSAVRRTLLEAAGIPIEVWPADIDERGIEAGSPELDSPAVASLLAREKAAAVARRNPGRLTIGADQILSLGAERLTKPADLAAARAQLYTLSGRTHHLHSAAVLVRDQKVLFETVASARLTMRPLSDPMLDAYLAAVGDAATTSVGAYQIEGPGIQLFDRVEGDYFTVLGLPLLPVLDFLRQSGWLLS